METSLDIETVSAICPNCTSCSWRAKDAELEPSRAASRRPTSSGPTRSRTAGPGTEELGTGARHAAIATVGASGDEGSGRSGASLAAAFRRAKTRSRPSAARTCCPHRWRRGRDSRLPGNRLVRKEGRRSDRRTGSGCTPKRSPPASKRPPGSARRSAQTAPPTTSPPMPTRTRASRLRPGYPETEEGGLVVGGTSLATPITAAYYALESHGAGDGSANGITTTPLCSMTS